MTSPSASRSPAAAPAAQRPDAAAAPPSAHSSAALPAASAPAPARSTPSRDSVGGAASQTSATALTVASAAASASATSPSKSASVSVTTPSDRASPAPSREVPCRRCLAPSIVLDTFHPARHGVVFEQTLKTLKKATQDPSVLVRLAFLVPGLGRPSASQTSSSRTLTAEEWEVRRLHASLQQVQADHDQAKTTISLAETEVASLRKQVAMLTAQLHAQPSAPAPPCSAKVDALKEGTMLARHEVRAENSAHERLLEGRIATLNQALDACKALVATPEQVAAH
ncbi:hypothetical protein P43SY_011940 [Pythium insidiosum]|uniref:Uncharacterized protein n=1 Tax=Pythium insidiosum TaxID=114742 RepID=A0AAD5L8C7_PYTIN|nr:hypothetical protein P43SY_011940 [Pythium insidiosum]